MGLQGRLQLGKMKSRKGRLCGGAAGKATISLLAAQRPIKQSITFVEFSAQAGKGRGIGSPTPEGTWSLRANLAWKKENGLRSVRVTLHDSGLKRVQHENAIFPELTTKVRAALPSRPPVHN